MRYVLDRFEEEYAVCENDRNEILNVKKDRIPSDAKVGDVLIISADEIIIDKKETEKRKIEIIKLMEELFEYIY